MIQLQEVSKIYPSKQGEVRALDGVSLTIDQGQFIAVRGHSGCGKSTLLSMVGGLALPTDGKVSVLGQEVSSLSPSGRAQFRLENIGFVFQMFHLLPYLSVLDNVLVAASPDNQQTAKQKASQLLEQFDLQDRSTHLPGQLSAGERQRAALARAMLNQPKILLADEPTGNLDPKNAAIVLDYITEFHASGGTVLLVTHDEKAASHAQRAIVLDHGKLQAEVANS